MSVLKCKMCGGALEVTAGDSVAVCEYCGTKQTFSKSDDEVVINLFNRANNLRLKSEFDKAREIYEKIVNTGTNDAEAYWGMVLCKYGIEYVEDPSTYRRVPTCHRTLIESVFTDVDYLSALENADGGQRAVYESEAKEIDRLQKDILRIADGEKPFDVFICYKETNEDGSRSKDSVLANDIYYQLTQEGFKVFYAAITLEDKLGQEYEPYIYAALNSAKVMLVIGTKPENFEAVWVRNEWNRYLKIINNNRSGMLIPCYRDMDAYDLPEEFSHLQAQDMGKIGFIQDLMRGIMKVVDTKASPDAVKQADTAEAVSTGIAPLLKRVFMFLEDGDWESADEYCEKVLDNEPECAEAYLGKLMAELQVRTREGLKDCREPFDGLGNYQKTLRFGDEGLKKELEGYIEHINIRKENERKDAIYNDAKIRMHGTTVYQVEGAISKFQSIPGWRDSDEQIAICKNRIEAIKAEEEEKRIAAEKRKKRSKKIAKIMLSIIIACFAFVITLNTVIIPSVKYRSAIALYDGRKYEEAISAFRQLNGFRDSIEQIKNCENAITELKYQKSIKLYNDKKYTQAISAFNDIKLYGESVQYINMCKTALYEEKYQEAMSLLKSNNYHDAQIAFGGIKTYKDSAQQVENCREAIMEQKYQSALSMLKNKEFESAMIALKNIIDYKDCKELYKETFIDVYDETLYNMQGMWHVGGEYCTFILVEGTTVKWKYHEKSDFGGFSDYIHDCIWNGSELTDKSDGEFNSNKTTWKLKNGKIIRTVTFYDNTSNTSIYYPTNLMVSTECK